MLLPSSLKGVAEGVKFALAAHQRRPRLDDVDTEARTRLERLPNLDRLGLALRLNRGPIAVLDRLPRRTVGRPVDKNAVDRRRGLQPGRRVDHIPGGHPLTLARARAERDQRLARRDPDPHLQLGLLLRHPVPNRQRRPNRPLRIVLMRHRRPEQRHHRIADELLDRAPEPLQLGTEAGVVRGEECPHVLRVHRLCACGEADEIGEEDSDDLALLVHEARRSGHQGSAAEREKRELPRQLLAAARADRHQPSLGHRVREARPLGSALH